MLKIGVAVFRFQDGGSNVTFSAMEIADIR